MRAVLIISFEAETKEEAQTTATAIALRVCDRSNLIVYLPSPDGTFASSCVSGSQSPTTLRSRLSGQ